MNNAGTAHVKNGVIIASFDGSTIDGKLILVSLTVACAVTFSVIVVVLIVFATDALILSLLLDFYSVPVLIACLFNMLLVLLFWRNFLLWNLWLSLLLLLLLVDLLYLASFL